MAFDKGREGGLPACVPTAEDKIVQHAVRNVLQNIYEQDFLSFSYMVIDLNLLLTTHLVPWRLGFKKKR